MHDLNQKKLINICKKIRRKILDITFQTKTPHIGSNFSIIEIIVSIYYKVINKKNNDIFILSKGHACLSLYVLLYYKKKISLQTLKSYSKNGSILMTHASHYVPGIKFSTGSLGHGLPFAVGVALANKLKNKRQKIYVLISEGDLNEGSTWESFLFITHHKLKNLIIILDNNNLMSLGTVKETINFYPLKKKIQSFGLEPYEIDGHDINSLVKYLKKKSTKPKFIIAKTVKGKGIKKFEGNYEYHYKFPDLREYNNFIKELK